MTITSSMARRAPNEQRRVTAAALSNVRVAEKLRHEGEGGDLSGGVGPTAVILKPTAAQLVPADSIGTRAPAPRMPAMPWLVILETPKGARVKRFKALEAAEFYADAHRTGRYQITIARAQ